jgi:hypothetical protein
MELDSTLDMVGTAEFVGDTSIATPELVSLIMLVSNVESELLKTEEVAATDEVPDDVMIEVGTDVLGSKEEATPFSKADVR